MSVASFLSCSTSSKTSRSKEEIFFLENNIEFQNENSLNFSKVVLRDYKLVRQVIFSFQKLFFLVCAKYGEFKSL